MKLLKLCCLAGILALGAAGDPGASHASAVTSRQYHASWAKHPQRGYYYRTYYYKPTVDYVGYRHHYVVYYPRRPQHLYFYNPYKKVYWGRCPTQTQGKAQYSLLAEKDRKATIEEIPESAFPKPGELPPVPESNDGTKMDLPPDDLPQDEPPGV
ncbi:MAG TPA: hypothetical protein VFA18_02980 [Gemmataceae bacterium]|nr:hypothetical protein [Gemmataceae bacterium]